MRAATACSGDATGGIMQLEEQAGQPRREAKATRGALVECAPVFLLLLLSLGVCATETLRPADPSRIAAIFPPWWSAEESFAAAGQVGPVSGLGAFPFIVAVKADGENLAGKLRAAGALFVVDGSGIRFCSGS